LCQHDHSYWEGIPQKQLGQFLQRANKFLSVKEWHLKLLRKGSEMKILISGAGIADPTLVYWLVRYGMQPTIVERSSQLRRGGYMIDFWGAGYEINS
jgi:hypothetical protein